MVIKIEKLPLPDRLELGEGPHWDVKTQTLYFVDILPGIIHKFHPATNKHSSINLGPATVSLIIPIAGETNKFLITSNCDLKILTWDEEKVNTEDLTQVEEKTSPNRINDGKCDPKGRLWAGTMGPFDKDKNTYSDKAGSLYSYECNKGVTKHISGIGISNGLAWDIGKRRMYYIDSLKYKVFGYDYDFETGSIKNESVVFDYQKEGVERFPDGMTIDSEGKLWVACFEGAKVVRIDPDNGKLLKVLDFPSHQITSVAFGGPNLDELYVTSANINQTSEIQKKYPDFGCTFKVTGLGVKGLPMDNFKLTR